jgi:hypothetical protein
VRSTRGNPHCSRRRGCDGTSRQQDGGVSTSCAAHTDIRSNQAHSIATSTPNDCRCHPGCALPWAIMFRPLRSGGCLHVSDWLARSNLYLPAFSSFFFPFLCVLASLRETICLPRAALRSALTCCCSFGASETEKKRKRRRPPDLTNIGGLSIGWRVRFCSHQSYVASCSVNF